MGPENSFIGPIPLKTSRYAIMRCRWNLMLMNIGPIPEKIAITMGTEGGV